MGVFGLNEIKDFFTDRASIAHNPFDSQEERLKRSSVPISVSLEIREWFQNRFDHALAKLVWYSSKV